MAPLPELTRNRTLVLDALAEAQRSPSAYDAFDALRGRGLRAPLHICRALEKRIEFGLVHKLESMNAFVACAHQHDHEGCGAFALAACERCGSIEESSDARIAEDLSASAQAEAFHPARTAIKLRCDCGAGSN